MHDQKGSEREEGNFHFKVLPYLTACMRRQVSSDMEFIIFKKNGKSSCTYKIFAILEGKSMYCSAKDISPKKLVFLMTTWQKGDTERTPIKEWMVLITMSLNYALN